MISEIELMNIATGFLDTNKYKEAIEFFTKVIDINPANSQAFELRGVAWYNLNDPERALQDSDLAIQVDNENHPAWYNKGLLLMHKELYTDAEFCFKEADKLYPDSLSYITGIIQTTFRQKKYEASIHYCNQILKEYPADKIALKYRALNYAAQLKYMPAIKDYLKLIEVGKPTAGKYNNLGFWYSKVGDLKKAHNNLSVSLQLNPTHPYALDNMGYVKHLMGDHTKALELINQSLEIDPSNSYGYKNRALVYLKLGKREEALKDLQMARTLFYTKMYDTEVDDLLQKEFGIQ